MKASNPLTSVQIIEPHTRIAPLTPAEMLDRAVQSGAGIETLERLMALQERWQASEARKAFNMAIASAKAEIPVIAKNRSVDYAPRNGGRVTYEHEDLAEIARTIDPILSRHGLSYRFRTAIADGGPITVTCILSHQSGHFEENALSAGRDDSGSKNSIQAVGSTQTYLQRYTLKAALGLAASKDDDGAKSGTGHAISPEDAETLRAKMQACDLSEERFCSRMNVATVEELPASRYDEAERRILDYARQKGLADAR
jgi:hypothetical protein